MNFAARNLGNLRLNYQKGALHEGSVPRNPMELFQTWFDEHHKFVSETAQYVEPNAVNLATVDKISLRPSVRVVLLKSFDQRGFVFYTNYESRKARELISNPFAALNFYWDERCVRVEGRVEKVDPSESDEYYHSRPIDSQYGAWCSPQSQVIADRSVLDNNLEQVRGKYQGKSPDRPPFWGGFRLIPDTIEFWQGRPSRLHDRILYQMKDGNWDFSRLAP